MSTPAVETDRDASAATNKWDTSQGALLITPLALNTLEDLTCPICRETYSKPPRKDRKPASDQEWAVSVDLVAEWRGPKKCCGHIMGRQCLDKHLKAAGAWRNKCPLCRDVWFHEFTAESESDEEQDELQARPIEPPRRSQRIAARYARRQSTTGTRMSDRNGIDRAQRQQRRQPRPRRFTRQLFAALEVEEGSDEVRCTLEEVQQRLGSLYGSKRMTGLVNE